jgi:predicted DNA-binding transcriptional regulator AlpA
VTPLLHQSDIARLLGVSRERVRQLRQQHADFPEPTDRASRSLLWRLEDIERWARTRGRISMPPLTSILAEADRLIAEGRVREVPARVYTVMGDHATYLVTLADGGADRSCTCPATGDCSHMAAALRDQSHSGPLALEALEFERAHVADKRALDRREDSKDRRSAARPWAEGSSGRRAEDALRQDLADAEQARGR